MSAVTTSADVCTPNPYNRRHKPINYGRVVAGDAGPKTMRSMRVTVDLNAFANAVPPLPPSDTDAATFWAAAARADMVELQAARTLAAQLRAGPPLPDSLGRALISFEAMLGARIRDCILDHTEAGGAEANQLDTELKAISLTAAMRGAA